MTVGREPADCLWRASTWRNVLIALLVCIAIMVAFGVWMKAVGLPKELRIGGTRHLVADSIAARLDSLGTPGRNYLRDYYCQSTLTLDLLFPIAYSLLFSLAIGAALRSLRRPALHPLRFLPFAAAVADYAENAFIVLFTRGRMTAAEAARALVVLTPAKWWLVAASALVGVALGIWALVRRRTRS
jgi:hypothetical protein